MGSCLKSFVKKEQSAAPKANSPLPETDRGLLVKNLDRKEKQQSVCRSNLEMEQNSSVRETKIFFKTKSTALFSSGSDRKQSSVLQYTLDHERMLIKPIGEGASVGIPSEYYTLVDGVAFVKKTMDCLRVTTPDGQSEVNCPPQFLFSTLSVSEGKPVDCIEEVASNKFIQSESSPIKLKLRLKCECCQKRVKVTFCKGVVQLAAKICPECKSRGNWSILDINCNFPVWGGSSKIENHEKIEKVPSLLRVMGCVVCFKFSNCQTMRCGCLVCKPCLEVHEELTLDQQCWMCKSISQVF